MQNYSRQHCYSCLIVYDRDVFTKRYFSRTSFVASFPSTLSTCCAVLLIFKQNSVKKLKMESLDEPPRTGNVDFLDLIPCLGLCCCFLSCYTEMPDCLGTVCESTLCCVNLRSLLCKTGKEENIYCKCISCEIDVIPCTVCVKSRSQICCLDLRAAFPPRDDFPCILNALCCTVTLS